MILIALIIVAFGIGVGMFFVRGKIEETIEKDMSVVVDIVDRLLSSEIDLLKADTFMAARYIYESSLNDLQMVLQEQTEAHPHFIGLTVINRDGIIDSYGVAPTSTVLNSSEYTPHAFDGNAIISTTRYAENGDIVFHVCVPIEKGKQVLVATIPGMFFSEIVSEFRMWDTGNIFMLDKEGTTIANLYQGWVTDRLNFIEKASGLGKESLSYSRVAATVKRMIRGESGIERFDLDGKERICVFQPISSSMYGWSVGVVAPLSESPFSDMRNGLLLVGIVCLLLSIGAACLTSEHLEKPYNRIKALVETLKTRNKFLHTVNKAATMLLRTAPDSFGGDVWTCMDMIARAAEVDRMCIWKNHSNGGELYCSQLCEWTGGAEPQTGKEITIDVSYNRNIPGWEETLRAGNVINSHVSNLSQPEQEQLLPQGIFSILVVPVFIQDKFWGFVSFDDCRKQREFSTDDEYLLRSGGLWIVNAIQRNEMMDDLVRARREATASADAKTDFLANMSHEMRTPLNAIIGLSELTLDTENVEGTVRENIEKVYNSGITLLSLINDILDISKIESGKFEIVPAEYDTPSLINDTATLNVVRIGSKPITFHLNVDPKLPSVLIGDDLRIKQIFNNLLSNAFKYTNAGSVTWNIRSEQYGDNIWVISDIIDTGVGIQKNDMEKLFSEYKKVDAKRNRNIEGTGLGLSICKNMVELMGGWITVKSEYGKGSTFKVCMVQGKVNDVPIGNEVAESLKNFSYSKNKRDRSAKLVRAHIPYASVLVVDDVPTNLDVARGMMKPYGMRIDCVTSGAAAIKLIRDNEIKYNAILMDHMMPEMDGIETTRFIREIGTEYAKNIPIIALTANAIVGSEDMFLRNGFQAFLSKPIDIIRMDAVINRWVRDKELEKKFKDCDNQGEVTGCNGDRRNIVDRRSNVPRRGNSDRRVNPDRRKCSDRRCGIGGLNIDGLNIKQALIRFGNDTKVYMDVLKSYSLNTPPLVEHLRDCSAENLSDYAVIVHGIKSSSRSIGAEAIGSRAEKLEMAAKAGDFAFVSSENNDFIETVQTMLTSLSAMIKEIDAENTKPKKVEPDAKVLSDLLEVCQNYDIDGVDKAMAELEKYDYESRDDLVEWLRTQVNVMGFKQIVERLSEK
jgi:signal transduction histidine kinase/DNA-binding response OmpR family regulator/HPt (histidine-containing phosphotransfer) domain-containing protein